MRNRLYENQIYERDFGGNIRTARVIETSADHRSGKLLFLDDKSIIEILAVQLNDPWRLTGTVSAEPV